MNIVEIFVDGAAIPHNPGRGGAGVVLITSVNGRAYKRAFGVYLGDNVTNNAAEIQAAIEGLAALKKPCAVTVFTDSQYVAYTMSKGWKRGSNIELWELLDQAAKDHHVTWKWVKGHAGNEFNELAHYFAEEAAKTMEDVIGED